MNSDIKTNHVDPFSMVSENPEPHRHDIVPTIKLQTLREYSKEIIAKACQPAKKIGLTVNKAALRLANEIIDESQ